MDGFSNFHFVVFVFNVFSLNLNPDSLAATFLNFLEK